MVCLSGHFIESHELTAVKNTKRNRVKHCLKGNSGILDRISVRNSFGILKNFRQVDVGLKMLRLVLEDRKYLQRLGLLAVIIVVFVLGHVNR